MSDVTLAVGSGLVWDRRSHVTLKSGHVMCDICGIWLISASTCNRLHPYLIEPLQPKFALCEGCFSVVLEAAKVNQVVKLGWFKNEICARLQLCVVCMIVII